jgi:hypothetical protein
LKVLEKSLKGQSTKHIKDFSIPGSSKDPSRLDRILHDADGD